MQFLAVNWHEGLFLQPHHFQAWDRHWTERISTGEQWQSPHGYGVLEIAINHDSLAAGFLQIDQLRCRTPGGTLIEWSTGSILERRDLRPALETGSSARKEVGDLPGRNIGGVEESPYVDIYIAVPRLKLGNRNVDPAEHRNGSRFRAHWLDLPDELDAASVKPVELRELNARILLGSDDLAGYDTLRIARVRRSEADNAQVKLDTSYIPPVMDCSASSLLRTEILTSLYDLMCQYSEHYSKQILDGGGTLHANTPVDLQRILVLQAVNPAVSVLRLLAQSRGIHPLTLYIELARLAGALDLLSPHRSANTTAAYDHENLGGIFFEIKRRIVSSVEGLMRVPYRQSMFIGNRNGMQLSLDRSSVETVSRWFLGIHKGSINEERIHQLIASGKLDWKLGSVSQVEKLFVTRAAGVELKRCTSVPATLPKSEEWIYYEVVGTERSAWKDVEATRTLAMRVCDSMLVQADQLPGSRSLQIKDGERTLTLQFALFGVS